MAHIVRTKVVPLLTVLHTSSFKVLMARNLVQYYFHCIANIVIDKLLEQISCANVLDVVLYYCTKNCFNLSLDFFDSSQADPEAEETESKTLSNEYVQAESLTIMEQKPVTYNPSKFQMLFQSCIL
jgi:hypothetical protein